MDNTKKPKKKSYPTSNSLPPKAFQNEQLSLFQNFLCNTESEREQLSNAIDFWDSAPRFSISQNQMNKLRTKEGFLSTLELPFQYRGNACTAIIHPSAIREKVRNDAGETVEVERWYYPSANEELVEDVLRKLAAERGQGFYDKSIGKSGCVFTLYQVYEELKHIGHTRTITQIKKSLDILNLSSIRIEGNIQGLKTAFKSSTYLPLMEGVTRKDREADPNAKWLVHFHPLVTLAMQQLTYRQYNFYQMGANTTQLGRWLFKLITLKFTYAGHGKTFETRYSTIKRDSCLLDGYSRERDGVTALTEAFEELKKQRVLLRVDTKEERGMRSKLLDIVYTIAATPEFIKATVAASGRKKIAMNEMGLPPDRDL